MQLQSYYQSEFSWKIWAGWLVYTVKSTCELHNKYQII